MRRGGVGVAIGAVVATSSPAAGLPVASPPAGAATAWFSAADYPVQALRRGEQGRVAAMLDIDASGRVTGCTVRLSSGSPLLDATTCRLAGQRGRYRPALDQSGRAIAATVPLSIRWVLPDDTSAPTPPSPAIHRHEHHGWWERLWRAHEYLLWSSAAVAALWLRVRRWAGWGRFDADGKERWGDRIPPRLRRRPLQRWQVAARRIALVATPVVAVAALLAWLDL